MARSAANTAGMPGAGSLLAPDLRKRIEIMAEHIARNGPDFENTVKQKNVDNPQFAFLYSGEGAEYYSQVLAAHRGATAAAAVGGAAVAQAAMTRPAAASPSQPSTTQSLSELLKGASVGSTSAAPGAGAAASSAAGASSPAGSRPEPSSELAEILTRWREPPVYPMSPESERQLTEVIGSLEQMASRDAVRNGRLWLEANSAIAQQIASNIMKRVVLLPGGGHRLHVLYLVHDVLQTEASRKDNIRPILRAFKPYLAWLLRPAYQLAASANPNGDECARVLRLLQLWVERNILTPKDAEELTAIVTAQELPGHTSAAAQAAAAAAARGLPRPPLPKPLGMGMARPGMPMPVPAMLPGGMIPRPSMPPMGVPGAVGGMYQQVVMPNMALLAGPQQIAGPCGLKQTPETVPVGIMASMLRASIRRSRADRTEFVPYKPLDPNLTPQMLPPMEAPSQQLLERLEDFYEDLQDDREDRRRSSSSSRSSSSRSRSPSRSRSRGR